MMENDGIERMAKEEAGNRTYICRMKRNESGGMPDESRSGRQHLNGNDEEIMKNNKEGDNVEESDKDGQIAIIADNGKYVEMSIWVWEAVLAFLTRMEMADRVSLVCYALKKLCWPRLHGREAIPYMVDKLCIDARNDDEKGQTKARLTIMKRIPIVIGSPPPAYILGFKQIFICYLDAEVLQFIRNIRPLLANIHIKLFPFGRYQQFLAALNGYHRRISLLNISSIPIRQMRQNCPGLLESVPAISATFSAINHRQDSTALDELIFAKIGSGKPFVLNIRHKGEGDDPISIDAIQQVFQQAIQPQSFSIILCRGPDLQLFQAENASTGEVLALERGVWSSDYELYRCPRAEVQQWREQAKKLLERENCTTFINFWT